MRFKLDPRRWPPGLRGTAAAVVPPAAFTLVAALPVAVSTTTAALAYVLAVVAAAAVGGVWPGLVASALSFLALNFFFTPPFHTFTVAKTQDLVALAVFLATSATVGTMLSRVLAQRARAERREREARLLQHLGTRLLSGVSTDEVLRSLARSVTDLFGLARCEITTELAEEPIVVERNSEQSSGGHSDTILMVAKDREVGRIVAVSGGAQSTLGPDERSVIQTLASQMALAIEGMRLASEAHQARVEAETNRLRAALFSSVTHDLRTPLASITASVTSLQEAGAPLSYRDRSDLLETIRQEAERLNRLVGNLLDLSRMRAGALTPSKTPSALDEVVEAVVARLEPALREHEVRLILRENLPEIPLDVVQIDQALTNILENAARFTSPGKQITVAAARWHGGVQVRIADQGPGIPIERRERVFEPFVRGDGSTGSGLGLAITRAIVTGHGGRIRVEDAPGGGAVVIIDLPGGS
jgi:two-component system, OmpR family, sensor histidine kinase KdpD